MLVTTLLNHVEKYKSFVYDKVGWSEDQKSLEVHVRPRSNSRPVCSGCGCPASRYAHCAARDGGRLSSAPASGRGQRLIEPFTASQR